MSAEADLDALRRAAAEALARGFVAPVVASEDPDRLLCELRLHRAELEMQNESLRDAYAELEASWQQYQDLFDFAPVAYLVVASDGRVRAANHAAAELFGVPKEELLGARLVQFVIAEEAMAFEHHRRAVTRSLDRVHTELTVVTASGPRQVRFESARPNPAQAGWRSALVDVTDLRRSERGRDHSERLRALGVHTSTIAHDIQNVFASVIGYADAALRGQRVDGMPRRALEKLKQAAKRGACLTNQLLVFARAEGDFPRVSDLHEFIRAMESPLETLLGDAIQLRMVAIASDTLVRINLAEFEQVLLNVTTNARHAMPRGGTFQLELTNVDAGADGPAPPPDLKPGSYLRIAFSDTGVGMSDSTRLRAFDAFFTTKPAGQGTGLGLAMVRGVVQRAGGYVTLDSALGAGTTVTVYLP